MSDSAPTERHDQSVELPRAVTAEPLSDGWQHGFYQSAALLPSMLSVLDRNTVDRSVVRAFAQWRVDWSPTLGSRPGVDLRNVLSVVETQLTRGSLPFCGCEVESTLSLALPGEPTQPEALAALTAVASRPTCGFTPVRFDSAAEAAFYLWLKPRLTPASGWRVIPQLHLASLGADVPSEARQRVDFALTRLGSPPVVVEVDGAQHADHLAQDQARDTALKGAGTTVVRVPVHEVDAGGGPCLDRLDELLTVKPSAPSDDSPWAEACRWTKWLHQCELAALLALKAGVLTMDSTWRIAVVFPDALTHRQPDHARALVVQAFEHLVEMVWRLSRLHGTPSPRPRVECSFASNRIPEQTRILIAPADGTTDVLDTTAGASRFLISDVFLPVDVHAPPAACSQVTADEPAEDDAAWFLSYLFRKSTFLEGQWTTIRRTLRGEDSIVLLPTGAGKSIAFQLAAFLLPGRCIVAAPILSLIEDQVDNLWQYGIDRAIGVTSELDTTGRSKALDAFSSGHFVLCYVAPERFQMVTFREALRRLTTYAPVSAIVIDEAHCVSEWGHTFRTAYLNLGRISREYCESENTVPPLVALTGTASRIVLKDVQRELGIAAFDAIITPRSFDRPELRFKVVRAKSSEKRKRLLGFLQRLPDDIGIAPADFLQPRGTKSVCGLVFCPHVNGEYGIVEVAHAVSTDLGVPVGIFSGTPPKRRNETVWIRAKREAAVQFKRNRTTVLVCTNSFGMGIDKPNIRFTVHIGLPRSIEAFYQEAGRAGRNRATAHCCLILSNDDPKRTAHILSPSTRLEEIAARFHPGADPEDASPADKKKTPWAEQDDVLRALYFHCDAFQGQELEVGAILGMLDALGDFAHRHQASVCWTSGPWGEGKPARARAEKALHRLVLLGVVEDYTLHYESRTFAVTVAGISADAVARAYGAFAGAYSRTLGREEENALRSVPVGDLRSFLEEAARRLVAFVYRHVEQARRRSLSEMLEAAGTKTEEDLRHRILNYLQQSEWDERLDGLRDAPLEGFQAFAGLMDEVASPSDAAALRGAVSRMLTSYPDAPALLLVRAVSEALCHDADPDVTRQNVQDAITFACTTYRFSPADVGRAIGSLVDVLHLRQKIGLAGAFLDAALNSPHVDRDFVRASLGELPEELAATPAAFLNAQLAQRCARLVDKEVNLA